MLCMITMDAKTDKSITRKIFLYVIITCETCHDWVSYYDAINAVMVNVEREIVVNFKGYLRYNSVFCHKVALDVQLMNLFIWNKNNVSFSRYLDFCVFLKSADFKICDVIISIAT